MNIDQVNIFQKRLFLLSIDRVPVLKDGNFQLYESRAITRYLNDKFTSGNPLIPNTPEGRGLFEQWASLEQGTLNPKITTIGKCYSY